MNASLRNSVLWSHFKVLKLVTNMRVEMVGRSTVRGKELQEFADWILAVGDGASKRVVPPSHMAVDFDKPEELISRVFPALESANFVGTDACILDKSIRAPPTMFCCMFGVNGDSALFFRETCLFLFVSVDARLMCHVGYE